MSRKPDERELGRRAMRMGMAITELPIMALLGYLVGRGFDREMEGAIIGVAIGLILLLVSIRPALKSRKRGLSPNYLLILRVRS